MGGGTPRYSWEQWYLYIPLLISQIWIDPGSLGEELGWRGYWGIAGDYGGRRGGGGCLDHRSPHQRTPLLQNAA